MILKRSYCWFFDDVDGKLWKVQTFLKEVVAKRLSSRRKLPVSSTQHKLLPNLPTEAQDPFQILKIVFTAFVAVVLAL
jgi:hypothetical protein